VILAEGEEYCLPTSLTFITSLVSAECCIPLVNPPNQASRRSLTGFLSQTILPLLPSWFEQFGSQQTILYHIFAYLWVLKKGYFSDSTGLVNCDPGVLILCAFLHKLSPLMRPESLFRVSPETKMKGTKAKPNKKTPVVWCFVSES
jgi:hypothetical protein